MIINIKAMLKTQCGYTEFILPQNQFEFDKNLTETGILTGVESEYEIDSVTSNLPELNNSIIYAKDIEELNYLAQLIDRFDDNELETFGALVKSSGDALSIQQLVNIAYHFYDYNIEPSINDLQELGEKYAENFAPDLDEKIFENIDFEALAMEVQGEQRGEFTDAGYVSNLHTLESAYNGRFFPDYDYTCDYILKGKLTMRGEETGVDMLLPASESVVARALRRLGEESLGKCDFNVYSIWDFKLMDELDLPATEINTLNQIAEKLEGMPSDKIQSYIKAADSSGEIGSAADLLKFTGRFMSGSYEKENAARRQMEETVRGLTSTAIEKVCVLGDEDAKPYVDKLREQVSDLVQFWNLDEHFIDQFDMDVADVMETPQAEIQREKPDSPIIGADGNIFSVMGIASRTLKKNGMKTEAKEMNDRVMSSGSYSEALAIITEYINPVSEEDMDQGFGMRM